MSETQANGKDESSELPEVEERESSRQLEGEFGGTKVSYTEGWQSSL